MTFKFGTSVVTVIDNGDIEVVVRRAGGESPGMRSSHVRVRASFVRVLVECAPPGGAALPHARRCHSGARIRRTMYVCHIEV